MNIINKIYNTDCLLGLRKLPDECVDCCITSPPYFNLRDYGISGQIGLEDSPKDYLSRLVEVFVEVLRVLKSTGTLWLNIGDSYAGSGKGAGKYPKNASRYKQGSNKGTLGVTANFSTSEGYKAKDLIGIPWQLAFALRDAGYYLRQDIIWHKPNPMPESVTDRCVKSHEYIFLLSKSPKYYFDYEAIQEAAVSVYDKRAGQGRFEYGGKRMEGGDKTKTKWTTQLCHNYGQTKQTRCLDDTRKSRPQRAFRHFSCRIDKALCFIWMSDRRSHIRPIYGIRNHCRCGGIAPQKIFRF